MIRTLFVLHDVRSGPASCELPSSPLLTYIFRLDNCLSDFNEARSGSHSCLGHSDDGRRYSCPNNHRFRTFIGGTSGTGPINEVKVIVSYDGSWSGLISNSTMSSRHNGTGTQAFIFTRSDNASMIVSAFIERTDNGTGILTVSLETSDGTVLQAMSVGTPKGIASINWEG